MSDQLARSTYRALRDKANVAIRTATAILSEGRHHQNKRRGQSRASHDAGVAAAPYVRGGLLVFAANFFWRAIEVFRQSRRLEGAPTGNDGAHDALVAQKFIAHRAIDVDDDEDQDQPRAKVVVGVKVLAVAEQRDHPARKQGILPRTHSLALAVERKAGHDT